MTRLRVSLAVLSLALAAGCASEPDICDEAIGVIEECTGVVEEYPAAGCVGEAAANAETVVANGCESMNGGKADTWNTELNNRCLWNFQCRGDLVCRPVADSDVYSDRFCLPLGLDTGHGIDGYCGDYCDAEADCAAGLVCKHGKYDRISHEMCLPPEHSGGNELSCTYRQNVYGEQGDICPQAAEMLRKCLTESDVAQFMSDCQKSDAPEQSVVAASNGCDGKKLGQSCHLLSDCAGALVCRPVAPRRGSRQECLPVGRDIGKPGNTAGMCGGLCDDDADCATGTYCIAETSAGNGMCLIPGHGPGNSYSCDDYLPWSEEARRH